MLLFGELLKLDEVDYRPILVNMISNKKRLYKQNKKNKPKLNKETQKIEKQCGLLW